MLNACFVSHLISIVPIHDEQTRESSKVLVMACMKASFSPSPDGLGLVVNSIGRQRNRGASGQFFAACLCVLRVQHYSNRCLCRFNGSPHRPAILTKLPTFPVCIGLLFVRLQLTSRSLTYRTTAPCSYYKAYCAALHKGAHRPGPP